MPNCCLRMAGIQSRTTHPASAGKVKYNTSRMKEKFVNSSTAARHAEVFGTADDSFTLDASRRTSISGNAYNIPKTPQDVNASHQPRAGSAAIYPPKPPRITPQ